MNNIVVSIITVCLNSEKTIRHTIESVLNQSYPYIEYIIVDGMSNDNTVKIAHSYADKFKERGFDFKIIVEKDHSMYEGLNNGANLCNGEIVGQINSDDWYEPDAVYNIVEFYNSNGFDVVWGNINVYSAKKNFTKRAKIGKYLWLSSGFCHPAMFSKKNVLLKYPYSCSNIYDDFDFATTVRFDRKLQVCTLNKVLANYSLGGIGSRKSIKQTFKRIHLKFMIYKKHHLSRFYFFPCFCLEIIKYFLA